MQAVATMNKNEQNGTYVPARLQITSFWLWVSWLKREAINSPCTEAPGNNMQSNVH